MLQLNNIDELVLEGQASSYIAFTTTATEEGAEDLDAHLLSFEIFQEDCRRRLAHLGNENSAVTESEAVTAKACSTDATKEEENVESGNGEGDKREDIKEESKTEEKQEEEEEEEEGVRMAQESLKEICNDLSTLRTPLTEGRSVRPKIHKGRIKSVDFQLSIESSSSFVAGQQVEEKPRPRKDSGYSFTIDSLEKELKNLLDMFLTRDDTDSVNDDGTTDITTATATTTSPTSPRSPVTTTTTTTTTTSSPVTSSSQTTITIPPRTPSPTPTITSTTTITPPRSPCSPNTIRSNTVTPPISPLSLTSISSTPQTPRSPTSTATTPITPRSPVTPTTLTTKRQPSTEPLVFTFPSSPTSLSSFTFPSPEPTTTLQRRAKSLSTHHVSSPSRSSSSYHVLSPPPPPSPSERKEEHHFFSTIKEGMKNFGRRNSLRKKKKKRPEIGEPQDFRTLTSTTSIKPDGGDPWIKVVK